MRTDAVQTLTSPRAPAAPHTLTCEVYTDFAVLAALRHEWDRFVESVGGDMYSTYDWCQVWWRHYGRRRRLCVLVFRVAGEVVGLMPMFTERLWLGPVRIRLAKFIGSDSTLAVLLPAVAPRWAAEVYTELVRRLLAGKNCDVLILGPLSGERQYGPVLRSACRASGCGARVVRERTPAVHNIYALPADCGAYLSGLSRGPRRDYERGWRKLVASHQVTAETVTGPAAVPAYDEFMRLHTLQWQPLRKLGHFGDWPGAAEFNRDLVRTLAPLNRAGFHNVSADGAVVSSAYFLRFGQHEHWRLSARAVGEHWNRMNLGLVVQVCSVESAMRAGVQRVDDGPGRYEYKTAMGAVEYPLRTLVVARGALGALKAGLLCRFAELLHLLYYRIWFGRIAPRWPLRRRRLWELWTRYHI